MFCPIGSRGMSDANRLECMGNACMFWLTDGERGQCSLAILAKTAAVDALMRLPESDLKGFTGERIYSREEVEKAGKRSD